ncbi:MAG: NBR1-Ig-like domain-containing protein [Planctomycetota bacterium]
MAGRNGKLISFFAIFILMVMVGGYVLLQDPEEDFSIARNGGGADNDSYGCSDIDRPDGESDDVRKPGSGGASIDGENSDVKRAGSGAGSTEEAPDGKKPIAFDPSKVDPANIEGPTPGWFAIQVVDREDGRPVNGTSVYFPVRKTKLDSELGQVKVDSELSSLQRRTNRFGIAAWSAVELKKLIDEVAKAAAAQKKEPKKKIAKPVVNVLVVSLGYADMFEAINIPKLSNGVLVQFKLVRSVMISGKVRVKRGGIVGNAEVDILQTSQQGNAKSDKPLNRFRIKTDGMGEFSVKLAENFIYTFEVKHSGFAKYTSKKFNFREDQREISILLEAARGISGVILAYNGDPIDGAEVKAKDDGDIVITGKDGKFNFDMVKDRIFRNDVNLRVSAHGYAPKTLKVLANDHKVEVKLDLEGTLRGIVIDEKGLPISGAYINCTYLEGRARYPWDDIVSDDKGEFKFGSFGGGHVLVSASYEGLFSQTKSIKVSARQNTGPVTLKLTTAATLAGLISADGQGIAGVTIMLDGQVVTSTDENGNYTLSGLKAGKHRVKISNQFPISDASLRQLPVFTTDGKAFYYLPVEREVGLVLGKSSVIDFSVNSFDAQISRNINLRIVTNPRDPVTGLKLTLKPVYGTPPKGVEAPKTIINTIGLPEGELLLPLSLIDGVSYEATFTHNRYFTATVSSAALDKIENGGELEVVLDRAYIIKGYIKDSDGNGIESAGVSRDKFNPWDMQVSTDIYGYFEFGPLKSGKYTVSVFKTSYYQEQVEVDIASSDPEPLEMVMVGANEIRIIVNNSGQPQAGAQIDIYRNVADGNNPDDPKQHFNIGTTDAKGVKYINFHWLRNYQVNASYADKVAFVNFNNLKEEPEREFTIDLEQSYILSGTVVDKDSQKPLANKVVRAHIAATGVDGRDGNFWQMNTNSNGEFSYKVPVGDYWFFLPQTRTHQRYSSEGATMPAGSMNVLVEAQLREDVEGNYAQMVSFTAPAVMEVSQQYAVEVTVKNMGSTTWKSVGNKPWRLGSEGPKDNKTWGISRVNLPQGTEVRPKETYTFSITLTAPAKAGSYSMQWRMVQDGVQWFGETSEKLTITVEAGG